MRACPDYSFVMVICVSILPQATHIGYVMFSQNTLSTCLVVQSVEQLVHPTRTVSIQSISVKYVALQFVVYCSFQRSLAQRPIYQSVTIAVDYTRMFVLPGLLAAGEMVEVEQLFPTQAQTNIHPREKEKRVWCGGRRAQGWGERSTNPESELLCAIPNLCHLNQPHPISSSISLVSSESV